MEEVANVMLEEATPFLKLHRSLSSSPIFAFPVFVGLLEDGEDEPPSNPVEADP